MTLIIKKHKPHLDQGFNGGWLLAVVAAQSIAVLSAQLAAMQGGQPYTRELNFLALSMWLWGGMLYIWNISIIFYRFIFLRFSPADLMPSAWITMGAMAISTLAGSLLVSNATDSPFLLTLLPFLKGLTIFFWVTGSWWIPLLLALGVSAWHVCHQHRRDNQSDGSRFSQLLAAVVIVRLTRRMGIGVRRPCIRCFALCWRILARRV